ncbi:MAG: rRNA maturation RNase YbeY [Deltaproteobacteria bacterium]|nr:rRNA maturation RNase YbeY [Deltaproteobacteria bacterium]
MAILIDNRQSRLKICPAKIRETAQTILSALDCPDGELSILIVDDPQIALLNQQYLDRTGPTNVIAFPMQEGLFSNITPGLLGDVVISIDTAEREGALGTVGLATRFKELLVHGVLHLFGYDHETKPDEDKMAEKNTAILKRIQSMKGEITNG